MRDVFQLIDDDYIKEDSAGFVYLIKRYSAKRKLKGVRLILLYSKSLIS
ncbi:6573_t:CDS:2 [Funneliformis geosporum]|uniref:19127_t:CDS:1 n=1 Tax=Funneliformis geosporum TaxID=1117311 RepID=A0A9W4WZ24_9GLOM|nr:6573_t:CDS:2 [Funneliformis geosporum]CAI2183017.1 19127_t:CDS:2 [Funneliformis geosporum]